MSAAAEIEAATWRTPKCIARRKLIGHSRLRQDERWQEPLPLNLSLNLRKRVRRREQRKRKSPGPRLINAAHAALV
jgi:hypothetical protein